MLPLLAVVTGPPAAGKTTVARQLSAGLDLPLFTKDDLKERLADVLGTGGREWSARLGRASTELLYYLAEAQIAAGTSVMIESNFHPDLAGPPLQRICRTYPCRVLQVYCTAPEEVLRARYAARTGTRHPIHLDREALEALPAGGLSARHPPLDLPGRLIRVDGTELDGEALDRLLAAAGEAAETV